MRKWMLLVGVLMLGFCVSAMAQETPKAEIFGGYSYTRDVTDDQNFQGGTGSIAFNANNWLGLVGDFAGYKATGLPSGVSANLFTYTFGPRLSYRKNEKATPFAHVLFGGARASASVTGLGSASRNAFAMAFGGGFDVKASPQLAIRLIQADYALTRFSSTTQNNIRISAGIVFRLGGR